MISGFPGPLRRMLKSLRTTGPAFVAGRQRLFSNAGCLSLETAQMIDMLYFATIWRRRYLAVVGHVFVIRREAFLRSGGFGE